LERVESIAQTMLTLLLRDPSFRQTQKAIDWPDQNQIPVISPGGAQRQEGLTN